MELLLGTGLTDPKRFETKGEAEVGVHVHEVSEGHNHNHDHDHDDHAHELLFDTWTYYSEEPLHMAFFQELLYNLPSTVFRAKGFVYSMQEPQTRMVVQVVGRRATITATRPWGDDKPQTRLVFISELGTVNYPVLKKVLDRCSAKEEA
jgi:G3E family GTPase